MKKRVSKKAVADIQAHPSIEKLLKTFRPRFGNEDDIRVCQTYGKIKKLLATIDQVKYRALQRSKDHSSMTTKMRDIHQLESQLFNKIKGDGQY